MADIPSLLLASLDPHNRKQAEQSLQTYSVQPAFTTNLLQLVLASSQNRAVRLAGSVYLKNLVKGRWFDDDENTVLDADKAALKAQLLPAMLALSAQSDRGLRAQIAETVTIVAKYDFPHAWPDLMDQIVASLSATDFTLNVSVLETAHSIFAPWRSETRSDSLFSTIIMVIQKFFAPFHQLFEHTFTQISTAPPSTTKEQKEQLETYGQTMALLCEIYYDLTCQDVAPEFEDLHARFFDSSEGWFLKLMAWDPKELEVDPDDVTPSIPNKIRTSILEIAEMYVKLYPELLASTSSIEAFIRAIWSLLSPSPSPSPSPSSTSTNTPTPRVPLTPSTSPLTSQSLRFLSTSIRSGTSTPLFLLPSTLHSLISGIIVPTVEMREEEMERFEDGPLGWVREGMGGVEVVGPRGSAGDCVRALVGVALQVGVGSGAGLGGPAGQEGGEKPGGAKEVMEVVGGWIGRGLEEAKADQAGEGWRKKDAAIYLFESVAALGSTSSLGVTSTNPLVDIVRFFSDNIFADLQADPGTVHPILQVDAIRYLWTFRNQLTKDQLLSVLPLLARHLASDNVAVYTYAAVAIDRILVIRSGGVAMFTHVDVQEFAPQLLGILFAKIEAGGSPEKVAENEFLMRCAMRLIATSRHTLIDGYEALLARLVNILGIISKNPSNPNFDQYIFESVSMLIRFVGPSKPGSIVVLEGFLFDPFTYIIQQDIDQYIPYVFQILAQMLDLHTGVPTSYRALLPHLLMPAIWQQKGSVPGLVKLLKAFLARDSAEMVQTGSFTSVLAVVQQRLIPSKLNDGWGFELLQAVVSYVPMSALGQYLKPIFLTLLTRLQTSKTDLYVYNFVYFLMYCMAVQADGLTPDVVIGAMESMQPGLWSQICTTFVVAQTPKMLAKDRKLAVVGLTKMLTQSSTMLQEPNVNAWPSAFEGLVELFKDPKVFASPSAADNDASLTAIDFEEQSAGYQAAYSKLAGAENAPVDPVAYVTDVRDFVGKELERLVKAEPGVRGLMGSARAEVVQPFVVGMTGAGYGLN